MCREIGGDYYDVVELRPGEILLVVADVAGKGAPAALLTSGIHALIRTLAQPNTSLDRLAMAIHTHIVRHTDASRYATALFVLLNSEQSTISYLNAGHNPGLLLCNGSVRELEATSPPLGLPLPESLLGAKPVTVDVSGDFALLLFTMALPNARTAQASHTAANVCGKFSSRQQGRAPRRAFTRC